MGEAIPFTPAGLSAEARLRFDDERYALLLSAGLGSELRVTLGGELRLQVPLPEVAVETFGGRRWARLSGRVALAGAGERQTGVAGVVLGAGGRRVETGPDGRYTLWLPPGSYTLHLLSEGLPARAIAPPAQSLALAEGERRSLDLTLQPAGALRLVCEGVPDGVRLGLNLFGAAGGGLVGCNQTLGGLPAGRYTLEPYSLDETQTARHPAAVELAAGTTREVRLTLQARALPETSRPTLTLRTLALTVAAPGEVVTLSAESNAPVVYAVLPNGTELPLERGKGEGFSASLRLPFGTPEAIYTVRLVARSGGAGAETLERQTLIRLDPTRALFETRLAPTQAEVGEEVTLTVETRFRPETVRLVGPGLELILEPEGEGHTGRFRVPPGWRGREVTLILTLTGERVIDESYRFRVR